MKEKRMTIRMTQEEFDKVQTTAARYGMSASSFIRKKSAEEENVFRNPELTDLLRKIHAELRQVNITATASTEKKLTRVFCETLLDVYGILQRVEGILLRKGGSDGYHKAASH